MLWNCASVARAICLSGQGETVRLDRSLSSLFIRITWICLLGEEVGKVFLKCTYPSGGKACWDCRAGFFWRVPSLWSSCSGVEGRFSGEVGMCRNSALWAQSHKPSKTATASPKTSNDLHLHLFLTQFSTTFWPIYPGTFTTGRGVFKTRTFQCAKLPRSYYRH